MDGPVQGGDDLPAQSESLTNEAQLGDHAHARIYRARDQHGDLAKKGPNDALGHDAENHDEYTDVLHVHECHEVLVIHGNVPKDDHILYVHDDRRCDEAFNDVQRGDGFHDANRDDHNVCLHGGHKHTGACDDVQEGVQGDDLREAEKCNGVHKKPLVNQNQGVRAKGSALYDTVHHGHQHDESLQDVILKNDFLYGDEVLQNDHNRHHVTQQYDQSDVVQLSNLQELL